MDLSEYELITLVPAFLVSFRGKIGPEMAVTNKVIVERLRKKGYKINDVRVRKLINYIRRESLIPGLVASSKGYYVSNDTEELQRYIDSLDGREAEIRRIKKSMQEYRLRISNANQQTLFPHAQNA